MCHYAVNWCDKLCFLHLYEKSIGTKMNVTQKGQGHDPNIFKVHYLDNGQRYGLGANGVPIGNDYLGFEW